MHPDVFVGVLAASATCLEGIQLNVFTSLCVPQKGCGYHLDLLVVSVMLGICSIMGLPWFVAATVLSISHVNSLKVESGCSAPGEQPKFLGIREQRVTGFMIFVLMGCSVFMTSMLKVTFAKPCILTDREFSSNSKRHGFKELICLFIVYSYAGPVWSLSLHGCLLIKRYSGKSLLLYGTFYFH